MAKKQTKKVEVQEPYTEETVVLEAPKPEPKPIVKELPKKNTWEIKDRVYHLKGNKKPISYSMRATNIYWFDEEKGYERELKYCQNQKTSFVDEMKGDQRLEHIVFRSGSLFVEKEKTTLQKLLSLYHPLKGKLYEEFSAKEEAVDQLEILDLQIDLELTE
jgi:hypothetical protein